MPDKTLVVRRVKMDDHPNRADIAWVLFRQGEFATPIAILTAFEMDDLIEQVEAQCAAHEEER